MLDEITSYAGASAALLIYSGSQPSGGDAGGTILASLTCDVTAFAGSATAGTLTLNGITADAAANNSGVASYFRITDTVGAWVIDGDCSTVLEGTGDLQLTSTSIVLNGTVSLGGPNTITAPNAG